MTFPTQLMVTTALVAATIALAPAAEARDQIRIVGSSTVYPFSTTVAEHFGKAGKFKTPVVESTGSGGGLKLFCSGVGPDFPDITNASRRIEPTEVETCTKNGVTAISEVVIGYDGIVLANSNRGPHFALTRDQIYRALAKDVLVNGKFEANPYKKWSDIDKSLPDIEITVFGPAPNHGTRDALLELVMDPACGKYAEIKALDKDAKKKACHMIREDGAFIEVSESYNVTLQKIEASTTALGVFGFSYLDQNRDKVQAATVDGVEASFDTIAARSYPVSRPLYFYVKAAHVGMIPGIKEFVTEFTSEKAWGKNGYLSDIGLIPMPDGERQDAAKKAVSFAPLKL